MSWKKTKLGKFLEVRKGKFKPSDPAIANLKRVDKINFSGQIHLSDKSSNTDMILIKKGDLLISGINVAKGAVTVYEGEVDIVATVHYSSYVYDAEQIDITFLKLFLQSPEFFDAIREQTPGGIKTEIKPKHLLPLEVIIPSTLAEQKEVAALYFAFQAKQNLVDSELSKQLVHLTQLRQALLREAMQGQLLPQDPTDEPAALLLKKLQAAKAAIVKGGKGKAGALFAEEAEVVEGLFDIPASWVWCTLDDIATLITDGTHQTPSYTEQGRPFLSAQNIKPFRFMPEVHRYVSEEAYQEYTKIKKPDLGDLLIARVGAGIGECAVIDKQIDFAFYVSLGLVKLVPGFLSANYLAYMINGPFGVAYSKNNIASKGGSAGNFNLTKIRTFPIPLPPLAEQHRIVAKLKQLMQHCDALEQRIRESRRLAEQLLQTALREALAPPAGTEEAEVAELEMAEAEVALTPARRGRPRQPKFSLDNPLPDLFDDFR